ncbi:MAG: hypothetical protein N2Z85_01580 [Patescibacteria group bacterium]|nr:hypothetical protein [Patescibacteria group bacterium]
MSSKYNINPLTIKIPKPNVKKIIGEKINFKIGRITKFKIVNIKLKKRTSKKLELKTNPDMNCLAINKPKKLIIIANINLINHI